MVFPTTEQGPGCDDGRLDANSKNNTAPIQVVMACDLVATMLFVFCHVVSTVEIQKKEVEIGKARTAEEAEHEMEHGHTLKLIPEPLVRNFCSMFYDLNDYGLMSNRRKTFNQILK